MTRTENTKEVYRTVSGLPPEDLAFLSGVLQALTAMYLRLHPVEPAAEPKKEEEAWTN